VTALPWRLTPEELAHEGFCDAALDDEEPALMAAEEIVRQRLASLPQKAADRADFRTISRGALCDRWDRARLVVNPAATRECTAEAKVGPRGQTNFRIGTFSGGPISKATRKCWTIAEINALSKNERARFSPYGLATIARYHRAMSNPQSAPCHDRRDLPKTCEIDDRCEYVGEAGWLRQLGQIARLVRRVGASGDCVPSVAYIRKLLKECSGSSKWGRPELDAARLLVEDLMASLAHQQLYLPLATSGGVSPRELAEARETLDHFISDLRLCLHSWNHEALCEAIHKLAEPTLSDAATTQTVRTLEALWFWLQAFITYVSEAQVKELLSALGLPSSRRWVLVIAIMLNALLLLGNYLPLVGYYLPQTLPYLPQTKAAVRMGDLVWRYATSLLSSLEARKPKSRSRGQSPSKNSVNNRSYWPNVALALAAALPVLLPLDQALDVIEIRLLLSGIGKTALSWAQDQTIVGIAKKALAISADVTSKRAHHVVQCGASPSR
jgi:hypothetical protein